MQTLAGPLIATGVAGREIVGVTANVRAIPFPQLFDGVTVIFPAPVPIIAVTELLEPPAVCVHPEGKVQV